jgi:hypothetical protein
VTSRRYRVRKEVATVAAVQHFRGRFNIQALIAAPASAPAPIVFTDGFQDASVNPSFNPTYHLGLWFNSPTDAKRLGCPNAMTPFNDEHNAGAGIQVLNTSNFPVNAGPLRRLQHKLFRPGEAVSSRSQPTRAELMANINAPRTAILNSYRQQRLNG